MFYRLSLVAASLLFGALSLSLVFLPEIVYWLFQLEGNALGDLLGKRAGMLFLGLAILCFSARNSSSPEVRCLVGLAFPWRMVLKNQLRQKTSLKQFLPRMLDLETTLSSQSNQSSI